MTKLRPATVVLTMALAVLLATAHGAWAQETLSATLDPSGMLRVFTGEAEMMVIELNVHGPDWMYGSQADAKVTVSDLPDEAGKRFAGTLPIPNAGDAMLEFTETVKRLPQGFRLEYEVSVPQTLTLNGLQISLCMPTTLYEGKELAITAPDADPEIVTLPEAGEVKRVQVWFGQGAKLELAKDTPLAAALELIAAADIVIQDLRQWEREVYEIRLPAIMEGAGVELTPDDRFHLELTFTFPQPLSLR